VFCIGGNFQSFEEIVQILETGLVSRHCVTVSSGTLLKIYDLQEDVEKRRSFTRVATRRNAEPHSWSGVLDGHWSRGPIRASYGSFRVKLLSSGYRVQHGCTDAAAMVARNPALISARPGYLA
jgi:hypothetical protein